MYQITKQFHFSASHQLSGLPDNHPCGRLHGHNYLIEMVLESETLDKTGFVRDYGDLVIVKDYINDKLDHRHLNDYMETSPTAENIAGLLFFRFKSLLPELVAVRVSETPKTFAEYRA